MKQIKYFIVGVLECIWIFKMTILTIVMIGLIIFACVNGRNRNKPELYENFDMEIVSINRQSSISQDKFHDPQLCNIILLKTTHGFEEKYGTSTLYREINTCEDYIIDDVIFGGYEYDKGFHINTAWLYNHQPGDIVHFDYMLKKKFFEIKSR